MGAPEEIAQAAKTGLVRALEEIAPDELTPREALDALYKLKSLLREL
jgi:DNA mismatch repair protein MutS